ncbi:MAG: homoserine dehydrogenase [Deltaproteobacteria bacterium]|jgi:homoserine dehydrogenase|nr:homoserine dehydrogenase [Deltaproteobacteria bacterium]
MATNVGILGFGTVGMGVARIITYEGALLREKIGHPLELKKIVVRDLKKGRSDPPPPGLLTDDPHQVVGNPDIQIVVELMGGMEPARSLILEALNSGQHVVTANKALLASTGTEIFEAAAKNGRELIFEAAVAGAIPVIRTLKEGLAANRIQSVFGILNGTTNYILSSMTQSAVPFADALKEAQRLGYAESDPTMDVEGIDAAQKLVLLAALAYGILPKVEDVHPEGITGLEPLDFNFASELGYVIKLLALSALSPEDGRLEVRLAPTMIPKSHLLAGVSGAMNAIMIRGHASGDIFLSGAGAGMMPTASAVVGDIIDVAKTLEQGTAPAQPQPSLGWHNLKTEAVKPQEDAKSRHYLRFSVLDRPGVLSSLSGVFSRHNISIAQVIQKEPDKVTGSVFLVILTHHAREKDLQSALKEAMTLDTLTAEPKRIRVEEFRA